MIKTLKGFLLKYFTRKKSIDFELKDTKKILFLRYDRIGDMIITTPVFRELKKAYPEIEISVLASKSNKTILENNPYVDHIYLNDKHNFISDFSVLQELKQKEFDVAVEFDHSVVPHAILRLKTINPKKIISVYKDGRYGVKGTELQMYDIYTPKNEEDHFKDIWLSTLEPFGITDASDRYDICFTQEQDKEAKEYLEGFGEKVKIGINLEGAVKGKKITYDKLKEVCEGIYQTQTNIQIIILTTPDKRDELESVIEDMQLSYVTLSYETKSILDVAALISNLDLIITPDTSIVHIASAFNKPVVTVHENNKDSYRLFAPTSSLNHTVFAKTTQGLEGYSIEDIVKYSNEFIDNIKKGKV